MKTWIGWMLMTLLPVAPAVSADPLACDLKSLSRSERSAHEKLAGEVRGAVEEVRELEAGYAFRLPTEKLVTAARWIALERRCCPFFAFTVEVGQNGGPLWISITGGEGVKAFLRDTLGLAREP